MKILPLISITCLLVSVANAALEPAGIYLPGNGPSGDEGQDAVSPARFPDFDGVEDFQNVAAEVREATGGIPIGVKMSAQHIEDGMNPPERLSGSSPSFF